MSLLYGVRYGAHGYNLWLDLPTETASDVNRTKNAARALYDAGFYCNLCKEHHGVSWVEVWKGFSTLYLQIPESK